MNNLSWFLYAVDVVSDLSKIMTVLGVAMFISLAAGSLVLALGWDIVEDKTKNNLLVGFKKIIWALVAVGLLITIIPSQKTMYLILGSEVGEEVAKSETGQRVQNAINKKLDEYLGDSNE